MPTNKGNTGVLVAHLAIGQTIAQAARAAGMSEKTARRRLGAPSVRAAVQEAQADLTRHALARLRDLRNQGLDVVSEVLASDDEPSALRLRAADLVLRHATAVDNAWLIEQVTAQSADIVRLQEALERTFGDQPS
jgi:hypothetical protein